MNPPEIASLSAARLAKVAQYLGLRQRGVRGLWIVRKEITDPRTRAVRVLKRSTKTQDLRLAVARAQPWVEEFLAAVQIGLPAAPSTREAATLADVEAHYLVAATCAPATRRKNVQELHKLLAGAGVGRPAAQVSTAVLDGRLVRQWQLARKVAAEQLLPGDAAGCERAKRGANAMYRQARSLFSRALLRAYDDAGLHLPAPVREFAAQGFIPAAPAPPAEQVPPAVLAKMVRLLPRLGRVRPAVWACVLLMFRGGLRNSEARKARWSWVLPAVNGGFALRLATAGDYRPKARDRVVMLDARVVELLRKARREGDDHLVPAASENERLQACYRGVGKFLRACGLAAVKGKYAYRLRGHAITEIMLATGSMEAAREFAGHTSTRTTEIYRGAAMPYTPLAMPGA